MGYTYTRGTNPNNVLIHLSFVVLFFILNQSCWGLSAKRASADLFEHLLNTSRYSSDVIPLCDNQSHVSVKLGTAVKDLVQMIETHQVLRLNIWIRLSWTDCMLTWDPLHFQNETEIVLPYDKIWIPDIVVFEGISDEGNMPGLEDYRARVTYQGQVSYSFPSIITSVCQVTVTYFPFDHQVCHLTFGSWVYSGRYLQWELDGDTSDISNFQLHNEWDLVTTKAIIRVFYYLCCTDPYPDVKLHLHFRRKPIFHMVTIIFPCFVITSLTIVGFLLPTVSGEKIALQMTVLLSLSVFLVLLQDKLPPDADHIPYLAIYFSVSMLLVCMACLMSGIATHVQYKSPVEHRMSPWIRYLFLEKLRKLLRVDVDTILAKSEIMIKRTSHLSSHVYAVERFLNSKTDHAPPPVSRLRDTSSHLYVEEHPSTDTSGHHFEGDKNETAPEGSIAVNEWEVLAVVLDRFFLFIYVLLSILNFATILIIMISYDGSDQLSGVK